MSTPPFGAALEPVNPFEPPRGDGRPRREPLAIRLLALAMTGVGAWSGFLGLTQLHRIGFGQLAFALLCFGLAWITWEKG